MAKRYSSISEDQQRFIEEQKMFFVATAPDEGRINLSPKGLDTLRVAGPNRVHWLNMTGSGNETAAHLNQNPRITLMFCAYQGEPMILRLYGTGRVIHERDADWQSRIELFHGLPGARQIIEVDVDLVQVSCGSAVPLYDYQSDRDALVKWAEKKGDEGVRRYWDERNRVSIDGIPTGIIDE
ncbi:MAG: pyridoxamine 5'-phosphate oxidase family protein [Candidatus Sedimenticola sp. 6PFRAG5]